MSIIHMMIDPALQPSGTVAVKPQPIENVLSSRTLLGHSRELLIDHCGAIYRLRITRSGKLILTK